MLQENRNNKPLVEHRIGVSIYFICDNALSIYTEAVKQGIDLQEPFVGNNMWVVSLTDPDGYKIFFESGTDVKEETTYSEWLKTTRTI